MTTQENIGEFLKAAGLITDETLARCYEVSEKLELSMGKVVAFSGILDEGLLRGAQLVQSLTLDQNLDRTSAFALLKEAQASGRPVENLLLESGFSQEKKQESDDSSARGTGELLVAAGAIDESTFNELKSEAESQNLPFGRILSHTRKVKDVVIWSAINAQVLIRDGKINRQKAVELVKAAAERLVSFERGLLEQGMEGSLERRLRLGELLVLAGLLNDDDLMAGLETSILNGVSLGQALVSAKILSQTALKSACQIQDMVDQGTLAPLQAADVLHQVEILGDSLPEAVSRFTSFVTPEHENVRLGELLTRCGWVTQTEVEEAVKVSIKNSSLLGKMLVLFGYINETSLSSALRCQLLIREGALKVDQAIIALHYARDNQKGVDEALVSLGFNQKQVLSD